MSKGLEALERITDFLKENKKHWKQDVSYIEQELKALEIIKNKKVNPVHIMCYDLKSYNTLHNDYPLTQQEYDLLKEVLKND